MSSFCVVWLNFFNAIPTVLADLPPLTNGRFLLIVKEVSRCQRGIDDRGGVESMTLRSELFGKYLDACSFTHTLYSMCIAVFTPYVQAISAIFSSII